jgi:hypothetical protein
VTLPGRQVKRAMRYRPAVTYARAVSSLPVARHQ